MDGSLYNWSQNISNYSTSNFVSNIKNQKRVFEEPLLSLWNSVIQSGIEGIYGLELALIENGQLTHELLI